METDFQKFQKCLTDKKSKKRDSKLEKMQIAMLQKCLYGIHAKYNGKLVFSYDDFNTDEKKSSYYPTESGFIMVRYDTTHDYNKVYDNKTFDAIIRVSNCRTGVINTIAFVMKAVENQGGYQDNTLAELGKYTNNIERCKDENVFTIFLLDGTYIKEQAEKFLHKSNKYVIATSNPNDECYVKNILERHLDKLL